MVVNATLLFQTMRSLRGNQTFIREYSGKNIRYLDLAKSFIELSGWSTTFILLYTYMPKLEDPVAGILGAIAFWSITYADQIGSIAPSSSVTLYGFEAIIKGRRCVQIDGAKSACSCRNAQN